VRSRAEVDGSSGVPSWTYRVAGVVHVGAQRGRLLGFPTANLRARAALLPSDGVYAGLVGIDGEQPRRPAMLYLGSAPTFGREERLVEVHLLDFSEDIYGRRLHVAFGERVACDRPHASPAELATSIHGCAAIVRAVLGC
jgi:riboflavin kinase / FMN adenylyltransferase